MNFSSSRKAKRLFHNIQHIRSAITVYDDTRIQHRQVYGVFSYFSDILGTAYRQGVIVLNNGEITALYRYPVKSFAGEALASAQVERYGLYGDRSHALVDAGQEGWDRFITARHIPGMLGYHARFAEGARQSEFPPLTITAPNGETLYWNEELAEHFQQQYSRTISLEKHSPSSDLLAVDSASVLIVTDSSIRHLETTWGKSLDPRRFRPNIIVSLTEDRPFAETEWNDRLLHMGSAAFKIDIPCERCSMINVDPDSFQKDPSLLKLVHDQTNLTFGMYASVVRPGHISVGDHVRIE